MYRPVSPIPAVNNANVVLGGWTLVARLVAPELVEDDDPVLPWVEPVVGLLDQGNVSFHPVGGKSAG
jgi:hypothetical protein